MNPIQIITKYYRPESISCRILLTHSEAVAKKAVDTALKLNMVETDIEFIREASLLHDIGICYTSAQDIGCFGDLPYICHGYMGYNLLIGEGLPKHALVCERHTGVGLSLLEIKKLNGLLPARPMEPISLQEKLIAYCDKFYSKDPAHLGEERSYEAILEDLRRYGDDKVQIFTKWHHQFTP